MADKQTQAINAILDTMEAIEEKHGTPAAERAAVDLARTFEAQGVRFKAPQPGMAAVELPAALAQALATARARLGDQQIAALLQQATGGAEIKMGTIRDNEKPLTKGARRGPDLTGILDGVSAHLVRERGNR